VQKHSTDEVGRKNSHYFAQIYSEYYTANFISQVLRRYDKTFRLTFYLDMLSQFSVKTTFKFHEVL